MSHIILISVLTLAAPDETRPKAVLPQTTDAIDGDTVNEGLFLKATPPPFNIDGDTVDEVFFLKATPPPFNFVRDSMLLFGGVLGFFLGFLWCVFGRFRLLELRVLAFLRFFFSVEYLSTLRRKQ